MFDGDADPRLAKLWVLLSLDQAKLANSYVQPVPIGFAWRLPKYSLDVFLACTCLSLLVSEDSLSRLLPVYSLSHTIFLSHYLVSLAFVCVVKLTTYSLS